jgi:hypothetical protein
VTALGVFNIVFAGLGLFGLLASIAMLSTSGASDNPVVKIMRQNPSYMMWVKISTPLGLMSLAALLTAGIGLLRLKPWARVLSIGCALWAIVFGLLGLVSNYFFLVRPMMEEAAHKQGAEALGTISGAVSSVFGGCLGIIYPIILLVFMTRPKVINAFRPPANEPPALPPV